MIIIVRNTASLYGIARHSTYAPPNPPNPVLTAGAAAAAVAEVEGVEKVKGTGTSELPNPPKDLIDSLINSLIYDIT